MRLYFEVPSVWQPTVVPTFGTVNKSEPRRFIVPARDGQTFEQVAERAIERYAQNYSEGKRGGWQVKKLTTQDGYDIDLGDQVRDLFEGVPANEMVVRMHLVPDTVELSLPGDSGLRMGGVKRKLARYQSPPSKRRRTDDAEVPSSPPAESRTIKIPHIATRRDDEGFVVPFVTRRDSPGKAPSLVDKPIMDQQYMREHADQAITTIEDTVARPQTPDLTSYEPPADPVLQTVKSKSTSRSLTERHKMYILPHKSPGESQPDLRALTATNLDTMLARTTPREPLSSNLTSGSAPRPAGFTNDADELTEPGTQQQLMETPRSRNATARPPISRGSMPVMSGVQQSSKVDPPEAEGSGQRTSSSQSVVTWNSIDIDNIRGALKKGHGLKEIRSKYFMYRPEEEVLAKLNEVKIAIREEEDMARVVRYRRARISLENHTGKLSSTPEMPFRQDEDDLLLAARISRADVMRVANKYFPRRPAEDVIVRARNIYHKAERSAGKQYPGVKVTHWHVKESLPESILNRLRPYFDQVIVDKAEFNDLRSDEIDAKEQNIVREEERKHRKLVDNARQQRRRTLSQAEEDAVRQSESDVEARAAENARHRAEYDRQIKLWEKHCRQCQHRGDPRPTKPPSPKPSTIGLYREVLPSSPAMPNSTEHARHPGHDRALHHRNASRSSLQRREEHARDSQVVPRRQPVNQSGPLNSALLPRFQKGDDAHASLVEIRDDGDDPEMNCNESTAVVPSPTAHKTTVAQRQTTLPFALSSATRKQASATQPERVSQADESVTVPLPVTETASGKKDKKPVGVTEHGSPYHSSIPDRAFTEIADLAERQSLHQASSQPKLNTSPHARSNSHKRPSLDSSAEQPHTERRIASSSKPVSSGRHIDIEMLNIQPASGGSAACNEWLDSIPQNDLSHVFQVAPTGNTDVAAADDQGYSDLDSIPPSPVLSPVVAEKPDRRVKEQNAAKQIENRAASNGLNTRRMHPDADISRRHQELNDAEGKAQPARPVQRIPVLDSPFQSFQMQAQSLPVSSPEIQTHQAGQAILTQQKAAQRISSKSQAPGLDPQRTPETSRDISDQARSETESTEYQSDLNEQVGFDAQPEEPSRLQRHQPNLVRPQDSTQSTLGSSRPPFPSSGQVRLPSQSESGELNPVAIPTHQHHRSAESQQTEVDEHSTCEKDMRPEREISPPSQNEATPPLSHKDGATPRTARRSAMNKIRQPEIPLTQPLPISTRMDGAVSVHQSLSSPTTSRPIKKFKMTNKIRRQREQANQSERERIDAMLAARRSELIAAEHRRLAERRRAERHVERKATRIRGGYVSPHESDSALDVNDGAQSEDDSSDGEWEVKLREDKERRKREALERCRARQVEE